MLTLVPIAPILTPIILVIFMLSIEQVHIAEILRNTPIQ